MIDITLAKLKYRNPDRRILHRTGLDPIDGTATFSGARGGAYKNRTNNSNGVKKIRSSIRPKRKAYGPW